MNLRKIFWGMFFLGLVWLGVASVFVWYKARRGVQQTVPGGYVFRSEPEGTELAVFGVAPDFSLTERNEETFSKTGLLGSPWVADFIFTRCQGQCPLMSAQMATLQKKFGPETGLQFVSFSVDPEWDTPEVLARYAERFEAEKDRWFFLTGPMEEINRLLKGFYLSEVEDPQMHTIRFILIDSEGQIRGYYDSSDPGAMKQIVYDVNLLFKSQ